MFKKLILTLALTASLIFTVNVHASETTESLNIIDSIHQLSKITTTVDDLSIDDARVAYDMLKQKSETDGLTSEESIMYEKLSEKIYQIDHPFESRTPAERILSVIIGATFMRSILWLFEFMIKKYKRT